MVSTAISAAGQVIGGVGAYETGKYNRDLSRTMATEADRAGAAQETAIRENARQVIGAQLAAQGASGFQMGTGSAIDSLTFSQVNAALDALNARREATQRSRAAILQGDQAYAAGKNGLVSGLIGAASTIASKSSDWASAKAGQTGGSGSAPSGHQSGGGTNYHPGGN